jgi:hypothetical protein
MVNYLVVLFLCVSLQKACRGHLGHDRMIVGCTTTTLKPGKPLCLTIFQLDRGGHFY